MRLNINLATQPYEDVGRFYRTWGAALVLVSAITLVLVALAVSSLMSARTVGKQTQELRRQMAELDAQKRKAEDLLNRPENRDTRDRSHFLNALIARKAFSWTQVFSDLEKIIPARVHVISITPKLTEDNQIEVDMRVDTDSREKTVELVRRMEESKTFRQTQVKSETTRAATTGGGHTVEFDISALYTPRMQPEPAAEPTQGGAQ